MLFPTVTGIACFEMTCWESNHSSNIQQLYRFFRVWRCLKKGLAGPSEGLKWTTCGLPGFLHKLLGSGPWDCLVL